MTTIDVSRAQEAIRDPAVPRSLSRGGAVSVAPLATWSALVVLGAVLVYVVLVATGEKRLDGVPLHAALDPIVGWQTLLPVAALAGAIALAPRISTLRWTAFACTWWVVAIAWAFALALTRGPHRVVAPLEQAGDYHAVLPRIGDVGTFLGTFSDRIATYPIHVQGHPPGVPLAEFALSRVGLGGTVPLALLMVVVGGAAVPLVLISAREVAGEEWARRAAPFLAIGPAAVWIATSTDALFAGVGAGAVALLVVATGRQRPGRVRLGLTGGMLLGLCAFLSYGLVLLALVPLAVIVARRAFDVVVAAAVGALPVVAAFWLAGFWWFDGLAATHSRYAAGIASRRPYELFLVVNLSILAIVLGPAVAVALWRLRDRACWLLVGGALLALGVAYVSGMSKSEVERIWLPFVPYVIVSAGVLRPVPRAGKVPLPSLRVLPGWLVLQGSAAILVESVVRTAW